MILGSDENVKDGLMTIVPELTSPTMLENPTQSQRHLT